MDNYHPRPRKIRIAIPGYDPFEAARRLEKKNAMARQRRKPRAKPPEPQASDAEFDELNAALAGPDVQGALR
jgi:hypothetical protein